MDGLLTEIYNRDLPNTKRVISVKRQLEFEFRCTERMTQLWWSTGDMLWGQKTKGIDSGSSPVTGFNKDGIKQLPWSSH